MRRLASSLFALSLELANAAEPGSEAVKAVVELEGVDGTVADNVRNSLSLESLKDDPKLDADWVEWAHSQAESEIRRALEPFGYYRPTIQSELKVEGRVRKAIYRIDPGPPIKLEMVSVTLDGEGRDAPELLAKVAEFPLQAGDILRHDAYESGRAALESKARELGYFDAKFRTREIRVDLQAYRAEIDIRFEPGKRARFGKVDLLNETALSDRLIRRFLPFEAGSDYTNSDLLKLQRALNESGYFGRVDVEPITNARDAEGEIPIRIRLGPLPRDKYQAGLGYGTDTGPRVNFAYLNRFLNRRGHTLRTNLRVSPIKQILEASYGIPLENPRRDQFSVNLALSNEDSNAGQAQNVRVGLRRSGQRWFLRETLSLDYLYENYDINDRHRLANLLIPGVNWSYLQVDDELYARAGFRIDVGISGAVSELISNNDFIQFKLGGKWIFSPGEHSRIIARGQFGMTAASDFDRLPLTLRFYTGGDNTVRGFAFNDISPRDGRGDRVGARYLGIGSLEYEQMVYGNFGAAVFYDAGNAFNGFNERLRQGVGLGLRWRSPIGLVRADVASAISEADHPFHFHIVLGTDL